MTDASESTPVPPNRTPKLIATGVLLFGLAALITSLGVLLIAVQWQTHPRIVVENPETKVGFEIVDGTWHHQSLSSLGERDTTTRPYLLDKDSGRIWVGPDFHSTDGEWKEVKVQGILATGFR